MACSWSSDLEPVVLEITEEDSKKTSDSDKCSLKELFDELSETVADFTVNGHTMEKPSAVAAGSADPEGR